MNLWIRSQDKKSLVKINSTIELKFNDCKMIIADYQPDFTDKYDGFYVVLGTYKTEERALEILDEIRRELKTAESNGDFYVIVYEMPEK